MPLVVSKAGIVSYVASEEILAELLGHENFDGEEWATGDRLIFEDGTESRIRQEPGEKFYSWEEPVAADLGEVRRSVGAPTAESWQELFSAFRQTRRRQGLLARVAALLVRLKRVK